MPIVPDRSGTLPIVNLTNVNFTQRQDTERPETPPLSVLDLAEADPGLAYEASKLADILREDPTASLPADLRIALTGGGLQNIFDGAKNIFNTGNELYKEYNKPISDLIKTGKNAIGAVKGIMGEVKSLHGTISDIAKPISNILGKDISKNINPANMAGAYVGASLEAKAGMRYLLTGNEGSLTEEQLRAINLVIERELADKIAEIITGFPTSEMADKLTQVLETENISCSVLMDAVLANYKVASNKEKALAGILATTNAINPNNIINDVTKAVRAIAKNGVDFKKLKELSKLIGATGGLGNITKNVINSYKNVMGTSEMHKLADGFKTVSKGVTAISAKTSSIQSTIDGALDSKFGGLSSMLDGLSSNLGGLASIATDSTGLINGAISGISGVTDTLRGVVGSITDPALLATINGAIADASTMVTTAAGATSAIVNTASKVANAVAPAVGALTSITNMLPGNPANITTTAPTAATSALVPNIISNNKCVTTCGESIIGTEINKTISAVIRASASAGTNACLTETNTSTQIAAGLSGTTPTTNNATNIPGVVANTTNEDEDGDNEDGDEDGDDDGDNEDGNDDETDPEGSSTTIAEKSWQTILVNAGINLDAIVNTEVLASYILATQLLTHEVTPARIFGPSIVMYKGKEYLNPYYGKTPHLMGKNSEKMYPATANAGVISEYTEHINSGQMLYSSWSDAVKAAGGTDEAVTVLMPSMLAERAQQLCNNSISVLSLLGPLYTASGPSFNYNIKLPTIKKNDTASNVLNVTSTTPTSTAAAVSGVATGLAEGVVKVTGPNNGMLNKSTSRKCTSDNLIALYCGGVVISGTALVSEVVKNAPSIVNSVEQDVSDSEITSAEDTTYADVDEEDPDTIYPDDVIRASIDGTSIPINTTNPVLGVVTSTENPGSMVLGTIDADVDVNTVVDTADKLQPGWNDSAGTPDYSAVNITDKDVITNTAAGNYVDSSTVTGAPVTATTTDLVLSTTQADNNPPALSDLIPGDAKDVTLSLNSKTIRYVDSNNKVHFIYLNKDGSVDEARTKARQAVFD